VQLTVAVDAKSKQLEKKLIPHVSIRQVVDMLNRAAFATSTNAFLPLKNLSAKLLPFLRVKVVVIPLAPFLVFRLPGIHGQSVN